MSVKRTPDPTGVYGDLVRIDATKPGDGDLQELFRLMKANAPSGRIERLRQDPALVARADELAGWLAECGGHADQTLLAAITDAERAKERRASVPLIIDGHAKRQQDTESKEGGRKGGMANKKRRWAEEAAKRLIEIAAGKTNDDAWAMLPSSSEPWEIDTLENEYRVYADGDRLCCEDVSRSIKKDTFFSEYYRPLKTTGK